MKNMTSKTGLNKNADGVSIRLPVLLFSLVIFMALFSGTVYACGGCGCVISQHDRTRTLISDLHDFLREFITQEFKRHQNWVWLADPTPVPAIIAPPCPPVVCTCCPIGGAGCKCTGEIGDGIGGLPGLACGGGGSGACGSGGGGSGGGSGGCPGGCGTGNSGCCNGDEGDGNGVGGGCGFDSGIGCGGVGGGGGGVGGGVGDGDCCGVILVPAGAAPGLTWFSGWILPSWMMLTEQLSAVGLQQMEILGALLDAKQQLEVQRLFDERLAQAHKDYYPSIEMCFVGTISRNLSTSERLGEYNAVLMTQRSQDRQLGNENAAAAEGIKEDKESRLALLRTRYCDPADNSGNNGITFMGGSLCGAVQPQVNKDLDYTRIIDHARTLDVDFSDTVLTGEERDLLSLTSNLFSHDVPSRPSNAVLQRLVNWEGYLDLRAVVAKRSVAENSLYSIIGMKTRGPVNAPSDYMNAVLKDLGVPNDAEATAILGERPSYYAQMEMLSRKLYQRPEFYTNLYGKPKNVRRKDVAMQAIGLMLNRDLYRSDLRSEALLAVLLETELIRYELDVQNRIEQMDLRGKETP